MNPESLILLLSTLGLGFGLFLTRWLHSQVTLDIVASPPAAPLNPAPSLSVIVPARNEARNIRRCMGALLTQDYPAYEIIAVDDRSTDATPHLLGELARAENLRAIRDDRERSRPPRLRLVQGVEPPPGWAGKPHALHQGAAVAGGDWLLFVDADTFAGPGLLSAALVTARREGADLFTLLTHQELGSFWEKVILPLVFTALAVGFPARRVNDPTKPDAIANGQFILIRREVYAAVGGHAAVRDEIAKDKALAERVKRAGYRLVVADGRAYARTRMYTSLAEIWEGWTKNIFHGLRDRLGLLLFGGFVGLLGALALPLWLFGALAWWATSGSAIPAIVAAQALLVWGYLLLWRARAARAFGISPLYALTLPLGALIFTAMMFASAFNVLSGRGVVWKGRRYT